MSTPLENLPWPDLTHELTKEGYVVLPDMLEASLARRWASSLCSTASNIQRSALNTAGSREIHSLDEHAFPAKLRTLRDELYRCLTALANQWHEHTGQQARFPATWRVFHEQNVAAGQNRSLSRVERLTAPGFSPLEQSDDAQCLFPMHMVALLSEPGIDFSGGEFVMTEQRPRMQSRPIVVPLRLGDVALIATARRPVQGSRGFYTVNTRHAVSRLHHGQRIALNLSFHHGR